MIRFAAPQAEVQSSFLLALYSPGAWHVSCRAMEMTRNFAKPCTGLRPGVKRSPIGSYSRYPPPPPRIRICRAASRAKMNQYFAWIAARCFALQPAAHSSSCLQLLTFRRSVISISSRTGCSNWSMFPLCCCGASLLGTWPTEGSELWVNCCLPLSFTCCGVMLPVTVRVWGEKEVNDRLRYRTVRSSVWGEFLTLLDHLQLLMRWCCHVSKLTLFPSPAPWRLPQGLAADHQVIYAFIP